MELTIKAEPKEIASLVLELQGKPKKTISISGPKAQTPEEMARFAKAIEELLRSEFQKEEKQ